MTLSWPSQSPAVSFSHPQLSHVFIVADNISVQSWNYSSINILWLHELSDQPSCEYFKPDCKLSLLLHLSHLVFLFPSCYVISAVCCSCVPVLDVWHPACLFSSLLFAACMFFLFLTCSHTIKSLFLCWLPKAHVCECITRTHWCWIHTSRATNWVFMVACLLAPK